MSTELEFAIEYKKLMDAIHAAVSFTYIDSESARLKTRVVLKEAAGWPVCEGEYERLKEIENGQ